MLHQAHVPSAGVAAPGPLTGPQLFSDRQSAPTALHLQTAPAGLPQTALGKLFPHREGRPY